jgi:hypothetical protein
MTYANVTSIFDYHWRAGLRPQAQTVMAALSGWLLPRGTRVEVNRDAYVQPEPYTRAQTARDSQRDSRPDQGNPAMSVDEIRKAERLDDSQSRSLKSGVLQRMSDDRSRRPADRPARGRMVGAPRIRRRRLFPRTHDRACRDAL